MISSHRSEFRSPKAFGAEIDVDVNRAIRTAEAGALPSMKVMNKIAGGLGVRPIEVILAFAMDAGIEVPPQYEPQLWVLTEQFANASPKKIRRILALMLEELFAEED